MLEDQLYKMANDDFKSKIIGTVNLFNEDFPFTYENGILNISFGLDKKAIQPLSRGKFDFESITGSFDNDKKFITFYLGDNEYMTGLSVRYYAQTDLSIPVKFFLIHERPFETMKFISVKIRLVNEKFRKFLGYYEKHNLPNKFIKRQSLNYKISYNTHNLRNVSKVQFKDREVSIYPYFALTTSSSYAKLRSGIDFVFKEKTINYSFMDDLLRTIYLVLRFIFYRQNVEFGNVSIHVKHKIDNKYFFDKIGECFMPLNNQFEMEKNDMDRINDVGYIAWNHIYSHLPSLFSLIEKNELYLFNLPDNKKHKGYTSINSVSLDASAFEFEYNKLYGNTNLFSDNEDRTIVVAKIKEISKELENENQKKLATSCVANIFNSTLRMKNKKALEDFSFLIKPICDKKFAYVDYVKEVSDEFVSKRNAIDHGLENLTITQKTATAYYVERILIYAMQLRRIGMNDDEIIASVQMVFELF